MKKFYCVFSRSLAQFTSYRVQVVITILEGLVAPLLLVTVLSYAYPTSGLSVTNLLPYYLLVSAVFPLVNSRVDEEIDLLVETGEINNFLRKPMPIPFWFLFREMAEKLIISLPVVVMFVLYIPLLLVNGFVFSPLNILAALLALPLTFVLSYCFSFLVGLSTFWIDEFWAIHNVKYVVVAFLGGVILPYSFFPDNFAQMLRWSPFPYLASWPARLLRGEIVYLDYLVSVIWIVFFVLIIRIVLDRAINKYSFTGG